MFPKASPTSCFRIATVDTASSGSEVPRATIVTPIINGETRKDLEMFSDKETKTLVERSSTMMLIPKITKGVTIHTVYRSEAGSVRFGEFLKLNLPGRPWWTMWELILLQPRFFLVQLWLLYKGSTTNTPSLIELWPLG